MNTIKVLFLILIFSLPLVSNAQTYFGVKVGGHLANFSTDDQDELGLDLSSKFGVNFGVYMDIPISGSFSVQPELSYISKGAKFEDFFSGGSEEAIITFNYVDIHILAKYVFGDDEIKPFVAIGPSYGYILKGFTKFGDEKEDFDFDDSDGLRRTEFGFNIGGGIAFPIGFGEITMDVRYLLGLSNLNDDDGDGTIKNKGFGINMGIRFPLSE